MPDRAGWQMLVSPAFPRDWPAPPTGQARWYATPLHAPEARRCGRCGDGGRPGPGSRRVAVAQRWWSNCPSRLQPLGIQGVRPLSRAELALIAREQGGGRPAACRRRPVRRRPRARFHLRLDRPAAGCGGGGDHAPLSSFRALAGLPLVRGLAEVSDAKAAVWAGGRSRTGLVVPWLMLCC